MRRTSIRIGIVALWALLLPLAAGAANSAGSDSSALAACEAFPYSAVVDQEVDVPDSSPKDGEIDVQKLIMDHLNDNYWWHIATYRNHHISIYLPVILHTQTHGWMCFSSRRLSHADGYLNLSISTDEKYEGKIVEQLADGTIHKPLDLSLTRNALALIINSLLMLCIFLPAARWYKRHERHAVPRGFIGAIEMLVTNIEEDVIHKSIGEDYKRYSPYLLTAFFFILLNNVMGLLPIFPGGANTTGNIAVTAVMALCTMLAINLFGNKEYWKDILWPDVPVLLKAPIPMMPVIEMFGIISKPFSLMIRLMANIMAGHTIILALTSLIFVTYSMGAIANTGMTFVSVILVVFMNVIELLVAYIQAYVFTMLSSVFIGMSRQHHH